MGKQIQKPIFDVDQTRQLIEKGRRKGWIRRRGGLARGFRYVDSKDRPITDAATLERIKALVIPPAWKHVRICPSPNGRLQVVGMDTRGRIQYRYHATFTRAQERKKFRKIEEFGVYLPKLKKLTTEHLSLEGLPKEKVLALIMRLINSLYFRVGTEHSEKHYKTFGVTTLHKKHLTIGRKGKLEFNFVGKSHVEHRRVVVDEELAAVVKELFNLGRGRKLFRYVDENGKVRAVKPSQVNSYLKTATDSRFSSKDFRTWGGTLLLASELAEIGPADEEKVVRSNLVKAIRKVAEELGNTPAVCRSSYVHPNVIRAYEKGITISEFTARRSRKITRSEDRLTPEEEALIKLLTSS